MDGCVLQTPLDLGRDDHTLRPLTGCQGGSNAHILKHKHTHSIHHSAVLCTFELPCMPASPSLYNSHAVGKNFSPSAVSIDWSTTSDRVQKSINMATFCSLKPITCMHRHMLSRLQLECDVGVLLGADGSTLVYYGSLYRSLGHVSTKYWNSSSKQSVSHIFPSVSV